MQTLALIAGLALLTAPARPLPQDGHVDPHAAGGKGEPRDERVESTAVLDLGERRLEYRRVAGRLVLREEDGTARASVFHVAYVVPGAADDAPRPITFCFNGGPGSSSVWLHLGAFGPVRVDLGPEGFDRAVPPRLVPNAHGLLELTDLVFVDPVTTGYSRAADGVDEDAFHGARGDVESVGAFVRLFLTRERRWASPVYLAGESYGTTRAAALAEHLQSRYGLYPSGLVLVSSILDFRTARFDVGNDLPYALFLPTYAATARYHGALPRRARGGRRAGARAVPRRSRGVRGERLHARADAGRALARGRARAHRRAPRALHRPRPRLDRAR